MKSAGKLIAVLAVTAILAAIVVGVIKLASGIVSGAFNLALGIVLVAALILIVLWMFIYAGTHKK